MKYRVAQSAEKMVRMSRKLPLSGTMKLLSLSESTDNRNVPYFPPTHSICAAQIFELHPDH